MEIMSLKESRTKAAESTGGGQIRSYEKAAGTDGLAGEKKKLRIPRTKAYFQALKQVDTPSKEDQKIKEAIKSLPVNNQLEGILSECGVPGCIIHAIDKYGDILAHFEFEEEMNEHLRAGYQVYLQHPDCMSVEVYTCSFCVIYDDGSVKFIDRTES